MADRQRARKEPTWKDIARWESIFGVFLAAMSRPLKLETTKYIQNMYFKNKFRVNMIKKL